MALRARALPLAAVLLLATTIVLPSASALSFSGESTFTCRTVVGILLPFCARTTATASWVSDSLCGLPPQPSPRDAYCLDIHHVGEGDGIGGGDAKMISDTGFSWDCFWDVTASSCVHDFGHHYAVHRKSTEPTGCHTITVTSTATLDVLALLQGPLVSSARACWNLN